MEANCEHRMHSGLARRDRTDTARDPSESESERELAEELASGCFRKLRPTVRVHLDTIGRRELARDALIFFEISPVNGRCAAVGR